ncbi:anti-sigma factor [Burkholderia dolosa]|uniref:anti-sigma factor family protein n=1 Tax=Burkholderia dolosa TaxID=152500 RepID=UPI001B995167|nr:anti-sigma factor [Burkholderia dolosa]
MKMDDILLMAYVDGELTPPQCDEVERAIGTSADVAARIALFEASALPYRRAFERQQWPPVPPSLIRKVAEIAHTYRAPARPRARGDVRSADAAASRSVARGTCDVPVRPRGRTTAPWLAAAFVAGACCCAAVLHFAPDTAREGIASQLAPAVARTGVSAWVMAAANYQRLYTRDTVAFDASNLVAAAHTVDSIRRDDGLPIRIPDLRSAGLTFKRIQRLNFNHKPLVQIVYLPEKGRPVALCVMKDDKPDTALTQQQVFDMDVVTWRRARMTYALIAAPGEADLDAIGRQIAESRVDDMLGQSPRVDANVAS